MTGSARSAAGSRAGMGMETGNTDGNRLAKAREAVNEAGSRAGTDMAAKRLLGREMNAGNMVIARIVVPALVGLTAGAMEGRAMDDFMERYRALSGTPSMESGSPLSSLARERSGNTGTGTDASGLNPQAGAKDPLSDGTEMSKERIEGFNAAVDRAFPMTPGMIRRYREILGESERAARERPEPRQESPVALVSLEPGEPAPLLRTSPSIASVVGFYDSNGAAWPIRQYVLGDGETFEARHLGGKSNNIVLTPAARFGFANLVILLEGHDRPVSLRLNISEDVADHLFEVHVTRPGPLSGPRDAAEAPKLALSAAGDSMLLAVAEGVDLPPDAEPVEITGVDARAWLADGELYLHSRHSLMSPAYTGSMTGPDGARVYRIDPVFAALFSVDGSIVRANVLLP